jgi:uncharacterized protein (TIGR03382 family)
MRHVATAPGVKMGNVMRTLAIAVALSAGGLVAPTTADACSAPVCWPGFFTPDTGAQVPANTPGFYWRPMRDFSGAVADPSQVKLTAGTAPATALPMTATALSDGGYLLVPQQPLAPQTTYFLVDQNTCNEVTTGPSVSFSVTAAAPEPSYLGELHTRDVMLGALDVATPSGSCSAEVAAYQVPIDLAITFESLPWVDVLLFETIVDGAVWSAASSINVQVAPGASWQGRATDLLYRTCHSDDPYAQQGLSAGPHQVMMRARLPGSTIVATSDTITVELWCPGEEGGDADGPGGGGCSATRSHTFAWPLLALLALVSLRRRRTRIG